MLHAVVLTEHMSLLKLKTACRREKPIRLADYSLTVSPELFSRSDDSDVLKGTNVSDLINIFLVKIKNV